MEQSGFESATKQVVESATKQVVESATKQVVESATKQVVENATKQVVENATKQVVENVENIEKNRIEIDIGKQAVENVTKEIIKKAAVMSGHSVRSAAQIARYATPKYVPIVGGLISAGIEMAETGDRDKAVKKGISSTACSMIGMAIGGPA